jgi:hypothetical protein
MTHFSLPSGALITPVLYIQDAVVTNYVWLIKL